MDGNGDCRCDTPYFSYNSPPSIFAIGVVSAQASGWNLELNRISWNGGEPKYDLRSWSADHQKMGKGVTLTEEALRSLAKVIAEEIAFLDTEE